MGEAQSLRDVLRDNRNEHKLLASYSKNIEELGLKKSATYRKGVEKEALTYKENSTFEQTWVPGGAKKELRMF